MEHKRAELIYLNHEQLESMCSVVRTDIYTIVRDTGPMAIREVAARLKRPADSLYHHFRSLIACGLILQVSSRRSGKRDEAVYDVAAQTILAKPAPYEPEYAQLVKRFSATFFKNVQREYERSVDRLGETALTEVQMARRIICRMSPAKAKEAKAKLEEFIKWFLAAEDQNEQEVFCAFTVLTPVVEGAQED